VFGWLAEPKLAKQAKAGAGEGNRTLVCSLGRVARANKINALQVFGSGFERLRQSTLNAHVEKSGSYYVFSI